MIKMSGVSNDDFLLNTLKTLLGYPEYFYRSVEIHSERRYKICSCLVSLGDFESFRNYNGFSIIFTKILDAIFCFTNVRIFLTPISITFLNPKILSFPLLRKTALLGE